MIFGLRRYALSLAEQRYAITDLECGIPDVVSGVVEEEGEPTRDPYDRVFWRVGQAVLVAFVITGVTLKQMPPDFEEDSFLPFEFVWKETLHRDLEKLEGLPPPP